MAKEGSGEDLKSIWMALDERGGWFVDGGYYIYYISYTIYPGEEGWKALKQMLK